MHRYGLFQRTRLLLPHNRESTDCLPTNRSPITNSTNILYSQCDIQMPIKNGYDTCREVREWEQKNHYPQIPIMALSANAMTDQIENAAQAGFNDYVTKPIKHNELGKMMMGLLDTNKPLLLLRDRLNPPGSDKTASARR